MTSRQVRYCNIEASCTTFLSITPILFNWGFFCSLGETTFTRYFQVQGRKIANAFNPLFCQRPMAHKCCHRKFTHKGWCVNGGGHQKSGDWPLRPLAFVIHGCLLKRNTVSRIFFTVKNDFSNFDNTLMSVLANCRWSLSLRKKHSYFTISQLKKQFMFHTWWILS